MKTIIIVRTIFFIFMVIPLCIAIFFATMYIKQVNCVNQVFPAKPLPVIKTIAKPTTGAITLWFDGAFVSQGDSQVLNAMAKHGFVGAISITTGLMCKYHHLSWKKLHLLQNKGWEITSQAVSNDCKPEKQDQFMIIDELSNSKVALTSRHLRANQFVMPCDRQDQSKIAEWRRFSQPFYQSFRTLDKKLNPLPISNPYVLTGFPVSYETSDQDIQQWLAETIKKNAWLILVFHQIDKEKKPYHTDIQTFNRIVAAIKKSGIPVVLPSQILNLT